MRECRADGPVGWRIKSPKQSTDEKHDSTVRVKTVYKEIDGLYKADDYGIKSFTRTELDASIDRL